MTIIRRLIRTNGATTELEPGLGWDAMRKLIDAEAIDIIPLHHLGQPLHVMLCDDNAYQTEFIDHGGGRMELRPALALKPINAEATKLYHANCKPGTTHQILGDVVIVPDEDFANGFG